MAYVNDKPVLLVCDDTVFVKKLPEVAELLSDAPADSLTTELRTLYPGCRNQKLVEQVLPVLEVIPVPKKAEKAIGGGASVREMDVRNLRDDAVVGVESSLMPLNWK